MITYHNRLIFQGAMFFLNEIATIGIYGFLKNFCPDGFYLSNILSSPSKNFTVNQVSLWYWMLLNSQISINKCLCLIFIIKKVNIQKLQLYSSCTVWSILAICYLFIKTQMADLWQYVLRHSLNEQFFVTMNVNGP